MKCLYCGVVFDSVDELEKHIKEKHSIHYTSFLTKEYLEALRLREKVKTAPKKEKKPVKNKTNKRKIKKKK